MYFHTVIIKLMRMKFKQKIIFGGVVLIIITFLFIGVKKSTSQEFKGNLVAFYNIENLFDTIDTPGVRDGEFTPEGAKNWNSEKYWDKIENLGTVLSNIGSREGFSNPAVIGLCEMENYDVLVDLVNNKNIKDVNYQIVHYDSPDIRGIDVALLYRPDVFEFISSRSVPLALYLDDGTSLHTRDQLVVTGNLDGERMHFIVNHWPSRYGGEEASRKFRNEAAKLTRALIDSIVDVEPDAKVIMMGDLNDDPNNESVRKYLNARDDKNKLKPEQLFNASETLFKQGKGTLKYRGKWNMFDQMVLTPALVNKDIGGYQYHSFHVFDNPFVLEQEGRFKGTPFRSYVGKKYLGGYSDHLAVYLILIKEI